jgi:hypothetical protein
LSVVARTARELISAALADTIHHVPVCAEGMMSARTHGRLLRRADQTERRIDRVKATRRATAPPS